MVAQTDWSEGAAFWSRLGGSEAVRRNSRFRLFVKRSKRLCRQFVSGCTVYALYVVWILRQDCRARQACEPIEIVYGEA
jgi:hypothetical protein